MMSSPATIDVLCIGHAAFDLSVFLEEYPPEDSKAETPESLETCGGPAANAAWLLSSWGLRCAFAGLAGDDLYGRRIRDDFMAAGTDVSLLELRPGHATPLSLIWINRRTGSRTIVNRKLPDAHLRIDSAQWARFAPRVLLVDGHEPAASLAAVDAFPDAISILDAGSLREGTAALAGKVHILAASERFARQVTGMDSLAGADSREACVAKLRQHYGNRAVVVTLGAHGLVADDGGGCRHMPAFPAQAVDTTGAGDVFHGALAFAVVRRQPLWAALRFASMAASLSVRVPGGQSSIPPLARVEEELG